MRAWCRVIPALMLGALFTGGSLAGSVRAAVVQPGVVESGSLIVTAETAEVREGPSPGYEVITLVGKGEIFIKQGRTGAWYYIRINDDTFGWINGRAVGRYQAEGTPSPDVGPEAEPAPYVGPYDARYYPYYPDSYYNYVYYSWGQPYLSWEWYFYGSEPHRYRTWDHDRDYRRDRDHDRSQDEDRQENDDVHRGSDLHRESNIHRRATPPPPPFAPRFRPPFRRR